MSKPSKKDIKAAVDALKNQDSKNKSVPDHNTGKLSAEKNNRKIRKQGV